MGRRALQSFRPVVVSSAYPPLNWIYHTSSRSPCPAATEPKDKSRRAEINTRGEPTKYGLYEILETHKGGQQDSPPPGILLRPYAMRSVAIAHGILGCPLPPPFHVQSLTCVLWLDILFLFDFSARSPKPFCATLPTLKPVFHTAGSLLLLTTRIGVSSLSLPVLLQPPLTPSRPCSIPLPLVPCYSVLVVQGRPESPAYQISLSFPSFPSFPHFLFFFSSTVRVYDVW